MSQLSPSMNDIPPAPIASTVPRDPLLSCLDTNPMPSPDHGSSFSPYKTLSSVMPTQKTLTVESPSVPTNTYIKLQDAVKSFKANTCRSSTGLPPKNIFLHDNKDNKNTPKQTTTHTVRSQSPVTPVLTSRGTVQVDNRSQSRNQTRTSITNTSLRESPSRAGGVNSSRSGLNGSREGSANRQSPPKTTANLSIEKGKYSEIHKRDTGIAQAKNTDIGKYRPQTSRPVQQSEEPIFTSANNREEKRREPDGTKFNVLREILHPENEMVQHSYEKDKNVLKKGVLFQRDLITEVQEKVETATRCSKHNQPYLLLNTVNKQLYCVDCAFHGTQANQTKQSLVSLKAASHVITDLSKRMYNEADKKINILEQNINVCKKNRDIAQQEYDNHIALIDKEFSELMDALRKRKLVLKKDLDTVMEDTFSEIDNKLNNLEFLKQSLLETKEIYSPHNFDANVEFYATYNVLKDALGNYDYQAFLLSRDHFNVLEIKGKSKIKVEIEAMGKVLPSNYTSKSLQRPKSIPRCSRTSVATCTQKEVTEHNYQSQQRSGAKSAEKYEKTSSIANSPERKKNPSSISPTRADTITHTQVSTVRNSTKQTKSDYREELKTPKPFTLKGDEDIVVSKKEVMSTKSSSKQVLATWSSNSNRGSVNPGTPNKENRQKFTKVVDVDYYGPASTGKKRTSGSSGHQAPRKIHIPEYAPLEKSKGLFEEIETLKFLTIGKTEDDESSSKDMYKEVESVLASIKNKEMFSPKKISFINAEFFKESNILTNQYHAQELYNMLPIGMKNTKLHYRLSRDGEGSDVFHERCDNQGPCVVLVKVDGSCVFGYYTPVSFVKSDRYDLCEDAFIFSLQNPLYTKPHKFPIKEQKKLFGIFQSTLSPCLGSTLPNKQDLFIQFDDLSSSCSVIGYAYALPSGIEGSKALAGKYTGWRFDEIEVYGLEF